MTKESEFSIGGAGLKHTLLVVGDDIGFSDRLTSYAIDMSARMRYSILAINISHYSDVSKFFSDKSISVADEEEIKKAREEGVELFRKRANERSIPFAAEVRSGDFDAIVRNIYDERGDIDLVVVEPKYVGQDAENSASIPAFSLAPEGGEA